MNIFLFFSIVLIIIFGYPIGRIIYSLLKKHTVYIFNSEIIDSHQSEPLKPFVHKKILTKKEFEKRKSHIKKLP